MKRLFVMATCLALAGCVTPPEAARTGFPIEVSSATRRYVNDLAAEADAVAARVESRQIATNAEAFQAYQTSSRAARERFNTALGQSLDRRSPPQNDPDTRAWRELADGLRDAIGQ